MPSIVTSMSVCLSASRVSRQPYYQTSPNSLCMLHVTMARSSSDGVAMHRTSGFVDDIVFSQNGPYGASYVFLSGAIAERTAAIPTGYCKYTL